jgi:uncharacterized RDD family membrane protein YckC
MKTFRISWLVLLTAAHSLLMAPQVMAQEIADPAAPGDSAVTASTNGAPEPAALANTGTNADPAVVADQTVGVNSRKRHERSQPLVLIGQDAELKAGESAEAVVVIGGSAKVHGKVRDAAVVIGGTLEVDGEVGDSVVAVLGDVHLKEGARIRKDAVAVLGALSLAPGVKVGGDVVSVGGKVEAADGAIIEGQKVSVSLPFPLLKVQWLGDWLKYCVFQFRPLSLQVGWVWAVAGVFFLLYLFVAVVFPRPVEICVEQLTRRPATTVLLGLLTKILVPIVILILVTTVIGLVVVPFISAALFFASIVGKVAVLEWMGLHLGRRFGGVFVKPVTAFLIGSIVLTLLYLVPILGFLTSTIFGMWGLGCAVTAAFGSMRREMPEKPATPPAAPGSPTGMPGGGSLLQAEAAAATSSGFACVPPGAGAAPVSGALNAAAATTATPPIHPHLTTFPKAGFWERMGAGFLDVVIVGILSAIVGGLPLGFLVALAYFAGLWTWKGTTLGGIVLRLQVVRCDGGPVTFVVALVRGLAAAVSMVVFFLGFLWIVWDNDKQAWHDKIAGTIVVRLPHSLPLVCV